MNDMIRLISSSTRIPENPKGSIIPNLIVFESSRIHEFGQFKITGVHQSDLVRGTFTITSWYFSYLSYFPALLLKYPAAKTNISFVVMVPWTSNEIIARFSAVLAQADYDSRLTPEHLWHLPRGATQIFLVVSHNLNELMRRSHSERLC